MIGLRAKIDRVRIKGFRSLADIEITGLPDVTVMIGANGSGKSNFIRFFEMLSWMLRSQELGEFVGRYGGADDQLFGGSRQTPRMEATVGLTTEAGQNEYRFALAHAHPDRFIFTEEACRFSSNDRPTQANWQYIKDSGYPEAKIVEAAQSEAYLGVNPDTASYIVKLLRNCATYQFHDTSDDSNFKKRWDAEDNNSLRRHGGNLAAVLYRLEQEDLKRFKMVCHYIGRILPVFERFVIEDSYGKVSLRWKAKWTDRTFGAHLTSDGSLRFFALVTLLNLPLAMLPDVILLDEPELGLHPAAIELVAHMIKGLAKEKQVIVATQSPLLVDAFGLDEIVVLDLKDGKSELRKLDPNEFRIWIEEDFTPGQLWEKNLFGGRP